MQAYVGQTRGRREEEMDAHGLGEMTQPSEWPPRRTVNGWASDNEVFAKWKAGKPFDDERHWDFLQELHQAIRVRGWWEVSRHVGGVGRVDALPPDFAVLPDVVADGEASLRKSLEWLPWMECLGVPLALVVQDGMTASDVEAVLPDVDVIFIGGSSDWKWATGPAWALLAAQWDKQLHIGRVGTMKRAKWARTIEENVPGLRLSIDSTIPLWSEDNMQRFLRGLQAPVRAVLPFWFEESRRIIRLEAT